MNGNVAILIVNGGQDPQQGKWLHLGLPKILEYTDWPNYHIYVWNNNVTDQSVAAFISSQEQVTLVTVDPQETLSHRHAVPLQRLYDLARANGAYYIVTLDSDAFPIRQGWLTELISFLNGGSALAGIWMNETREGIKPYIHPSCLSTTVNFIEENQLSLKYVGPKRKVKHDTLSHFTDKALELNLPISKLFRSNRNEIHRIIGGIYGDMVYHHGAGSRPGAQFWDEKRDVIVNQRNMQIRDLAAEMLFNNFQAYIDWLRGVQTTSKAFFILGMHRSGTSCLTGCLERCGLHLGDVTRYNKGNLRGNHEFRQVVRLHNKILASSNGTWSSPPKQIRIGSKHLEEITSIIQQFAAQAPYALKDPRLLLLAETWLELVDDFALIATYRHPVAVARSLARRDKMTQSEALALWTHYNCKLVHLHQKYQFPIIKFDLSDPERYSEEVASVAVKWGLRPNLNSIRNFINTDLDHYADIESIPIPAECEAVYHYLKEHTYHVSDEIDSFEALLLRWGRLVDAEVHVTFSERFKYRMYRIIGLIPLPIRLVGRRFLKVLKVHLKAKS